MDIKHKKKVFNTIVSREFSINVSLLNCIWYGRVLKNVDQQFERK